MEKKIVFVNLKEIYSKKKNEAFYRLTYLADKEAIINFIDKETFEKIKAKNLQFLGKYKAIFELNVQFKTFKIIDIKG